jgi:hypothetical protein
MAEASSTPTIEELAGSNFAASQFVSPIKDNNEDKNEDDDEDNKEDNGDMNAASQFVSPIGDGSEDKDEDDDEENDGDNDEDFNEGNDEDEVFINKFNSYNHLNYSHDHLDLDNYLAPGRLKVVEEKEADLEVKLRELEKSTQTAVATALFLENEAKLHKQEIQGLVEEVMKEKRKTAILEVELSCVKDSYPGHESRIFELEKKLEIEGSVAEDRLRNIKRLSSALPSSLPSSSLSSSPPSLSSPSSSASLPSLSSSLSSSSSSSSSLSSSGV